MVVHFNPDDILPILPTQLARLAGKSLRKLLQKALKELIDLGGDGDIFENLPRLSGISNDRLQPPDDPGRPQKPEHDC